MCVGEASHSAPSKTGILGVKERFVTLFLGFGSLQVRWVYRALKKYCNLLQRGCFESREMFGADGGPQG